jgi:threonine synthase
MQEIFGNDWKGMARGISGFAVSDNQTRAAIREVHERFNYVIDPHGAVGYLAAKAWLKENPDDITIILETAHPAKFPDIIEQELGSGLLEIPERLACLEDEAKVSISMPASSDALIEWLRS